MNEDGSYNIGEWVRFSALFQDIEGQYGDPTLVKFKIRTPNCRELNFKRDGNLNDIPDDPEIVRDGVGSYHLDFRFTASGFYWLSVIGEGTINAVLSPQTFQVRNNPFKNPF